MAQREEGLEARERQTLTEDDLINEVLATFEDVESERFKEIMHSLVRHLHAFVRAVQLIEEEWFQAIKFLTRIGQISDNNRQKFILP